MVMLEEINHTCPVDPCSDSACEVEVNCSGAWAHEISWVLHP